jgi:hypothetical protein
MNETTGGLAAHFFKALHDLLGGAFGDLLFAGHRTQNPLVVQLDGLPCRFLKLRLPGQCCLHLETVMVYDDTPSRRVNIAPHARVSASSTYPGGESLLHKRQLVDPDNAGIGIHTDVGQAQWVSLEFDVAHRIAEVHVYNRDDMWASRAWGLVIELSLDGQIWQEIYNHGARQMQLIQCLHAAVDHPGHNAHDRRTALECVEIVRMLFAGQQDACVARLEQMQWQDAVAATEIRRQITSAVLAGCQLVWNSHGVVRPFRYWSVDEKTAYLQQVKELVEDLRRLSTSVCLGFGFVLAHVRDGDLIPHDDDLDVLIAFDRRECPSISQGLRLLRAHLAECGYEVSGDLFSHRWVMKPGWNWAFPYVDVFVGLVEDGRVSWYPSARGLLETQDVFPPLVVQQFGIECLIPRNPLKYLALTYGEHWRRPDPGFGHPWDEAGYSDIA